MTADLTVVGLGIRCPDQVTKETERALRQSNHVFFVDTGLDTRSYLESVCDRVTPLFDDSYVEGDNRISAYQHMAATVVAAAMDHGPVVFAVQGHPTVFVNAPFLMRDMAELLDLSFEVLPGVSSMACLFAELMIDPGVHGIAMYEATDLLLRRRPLVRDVPTLIWQIGSLETQLHTTRAGRPERFRRFVAALCETYPPEHRVTALFSSPHPSVPSQRLDTTIAGLPDLASEIHVGFTLYLPPTRIRPVWDVELWEQMGQAEHLDRITEPE